MLVEVVLTAALAVLLWAAFFRKPEGLPPGRWGLPAIGFIPLTRKSMEEQILDLHKKHGNIVLWRIGNQLMVFISDYQLGKEALSRSDFANRPDWDMFKLLEEVPLGVGSSNGAHWHANRRFALRQLRDLGMGKSKLVAGIQEQALKLVEILKQQANKAAPVPHALKVAVVNVIWQMVAGKMFEMEDEKLIEFDKLLKDLNAATFAVGVRDFFPGLKYLPKYLQNILFSMDRIEGFKEKFLNYLDELVIEHKASLDPDNPGDLIDAYLLELKEGSESPDVIRSERDLGLLVLDLFFAGSETTTYTLTFMMQYLAMNPDIQKTMQEEIDQVLPKGILATLEDKPRLPYTEAVLHEILRLSSLLPVGAQHSAVTDTQLGGYYIPKGTIIATSAMSMHSDPRYWEKPEALKPERWLDENGKFTTKKEGFMPFGSGKRACLGESLARMELLIFATAMLQSLSFAPPPGSTVDVTADPAVPMFHTPRNQDIFITIR
ncbi:cytochrome P450 2L1-like [Penaeus chinensis]|uniref:cytochrome P450 2L1-like n=1 Tax=Penaeus chinensis TaxID=139456 RepID=UPI001FB6EC44|nr:cytochrome P450 2L1-like [Penaeus chinensis]